MRAVSAGGCMAKDLDSQRRMELGNRKQSGWLWWHKKHDPPCNSQADVVSVEPLTFPAVKLSGTLEIWTASGQMHEIEHTYTYQRRKAIFICNSSRLLPSLSEKVRPFHATEWVAKINCSQWTLKSKNLCILFLEKLLLYIPHRSNVVSEGSRLITLSRLTASS